MRRKAILLCFTILITILLNGCGNAELSDAQTEEAADEPLFSTAEPIPFLTVPAPERFEVGAELEMFTKNFNDTYFNKRGRYLFSDEHWWFDYGTVNDNASGKKLQQYKYLENIRSYLDPEILVITDKDSGDIISASVSWSTTERLTEQTTQTFEDYFYCVAAAFIPDISDGFLEELLENLCENEVWVEHNEEPYPDVLYFTDKIYCYAYFRGGAETIYFGTDVTEKLSEYASNGVNCIEIANVKPAGAEADLSSCFGGLSGTAVLLDRSGDYTVYNKAASWHRVSPCSTFKIISTLAAFEYGAVTPTQSFIAWDGTKWKIEAWNRDLTITEAFQSSCVWYYRKLIDNIGKENMTNFLEKLDYGNHDTGQWEGSGFNNNALIDGFWIESSLLISPREQVDVLYRIFEGKTEFDKNNIAELKEMMYKEIKDSDIKIYGKTGSGRGGWFVGFFEVDGENTYFAVYLNEQDGADGPKAQEIACNIINKYLEPV